MKIVIEVDVEEENTTADLEILKDEVEVAQKVHEALNLYKGDFVRVTTKFETYFKHKGNRLLHIEFPPDDPWESTGYTGRPGPAETWDK